MKQVADHVRDILLQDITTLDFLKKGLLNTRAYAKTLLPVIAQRSLLMPSLGSVVTALSRIKKDVSSNGLTLKQFQIKNIELKLPITEIVIKKSGNTFELLASLYSKLSTDEKASLNIINVAYELDIFVSSDLVETIINHFGESECQEIEPDLAAVLLEYDPDYRNYYGMAAQVLMSLANNRINMLECATTYSELIIYISQDQSQKCIEVLQNEFLT
jgi:aspartokinase